MIGVAFSPDGGAIVTGVESGKVWLWDAATRRPQLSFIAQGWVRSPIALSPDGQLLLTGSRDSTAQLWDRATGKPFGPPLQHPHHVTAAAFGPDGATIVTGCADHQARIWKTWAPAEGTAERLSLWVQVTTGMALQDDGEVKVLNARDWRQRRERLEGLGGSPFP